MIETVNSKGAMRELARSVDVPVSAGMLAEDAEQIRLIAQEVGLPCVLKPVSSYSRAQVNSKQYVRKAFTQQDLEALLSGEFKDKPAVIERNFIGVGVGVTVLCRDGNVLAAMQHQRLHEPLHGGGSSYRKTTPLSDDLLGYTSKLMTVVGYTGVAMVEFKRNLDTGEAIFIEVNGRFAGSLPLCLAAKFDLPTWYGDMLLDGRSDFPTAYLIGRYARAISSEARWFKHNLRADKSDKTLATVPVYKTLLEPLRFFAGAETLDSMPLDDLQPGKDELSQLVRERVLYRRYQRPPVRRDKRLPTGSRVLVVCKGNICRSPFAEKVLSNLRSDLTVESAGYYPVDGRPSPPAAVQAASDFGVDLTHHRSKKLTDNMLASAHAVIVFDREHFVELALYHPAAISKVFALGATYIEDPFGKSFDEFVECYREIAELCGALAETLR
ncbi:hypothetical protein [Mycobacterium sp. ENV421]|uniref:arsenate reductase/protein-tyrosine-phosphatase family protein n=1 Tax=Mycobacterium sp. ENV421 TaxID=1213407 RepID=UPI001304F146|nr:hypothetical protein [Mycobacterium sp. ENV421]